MTATRDRHSDLEISDEPAWDERPIIGASRGLPWWGAVVVAFGVTAIAAVIDMQRSDTLGRIFQVAYVASCVVAIAWVRRRSVFTAMVQPPLVFAVAFVGAYLFFKDQPGGVGGIKQFTLSVGLPLANNFPTMAIGTAVVVIIGAVRLYTQRDPERSDPASARGGRADRDDPAGAPPSRAARGRREPREEVGPPAGRGRFSRGGREDPASADRAVRAERAERAGSPDRRRQGNRAEGVDRPGRQARGERGVPPERRRGADRGDRGRSRGEPGADRNDRRGRDARDPRAGRPQRDERGRGADPRRGGNGGRPQPPRRRPRDER